MPSAPRRETVGRRSDAVVLSSLAMELHAALAARELTTARLLRDERAGGFDLRLSRDWDPALDWAGYARRFCVDQVRCAAPVVLRDADARGLLLEAGASGALEDLEALMRAGGHEMIVMRVHAGLQMRAVNNVHSSRMGMNNGHHAIRAGGIRRHGVDEPEADVFVDGLNLGRGMSYKNAAAQIPFGGCKMTVQSRPFSLDDAARLGFVAYCIDAGHFFTGPDMGFVPELADALRARFTRNIVGGPGGVMGPTGVPTALGTFIAMQACAAERWGEGGLAGKTGLVQGLGAVGLPLARLMKSAQMKLLVCDTDRVRLEEARAELCGLQVVDPALALEAACDVLAPCALGGVLTAQVIDKLDCKIICGSANNQLAAVSKDQELVLAERVMARGIVYPPEWTHNIAGVLAGQEEYLHQDDAKMERLDPHLDRVCRVGTRQRLARSATSGMTPTVLAYEEVEQRIHRAG